MYRLERVVGGGIIAPRRSSSAHLHRPWRATSPKPVADRGLPGVVAKKAKSGLLRDHNH
jgi:hypothetical protein